MAMAFHDAAERGDKTIVNRIPIEVCHTASSLTAYLFLQFPVFCKRHARMHKVRLKAPRHQDTVLTGCDQFLRRSAGVIYRYWYDDAVVAMDLCIEGNNSLIILKTTYDESISGTSPALLMRYDYFPALFHEQRLQRVEFYGKLMEWHTRWSAEVRTIYHCNIYRWGFLLTLHQWIKPRKKKTFPALADAAGQ